MNSPRRIDTHFHVVPPAYRKWLVSKNVDAGGCAIPEWSVESAIETMDSLRVEFSLLSVSTPGVHLGDDHEARSMAREVNEFSAELARRHPGRFGFFATLPLPDVVGAIDEAAYALDVLGARGVVLQASIRGRYLGDPEWEPLMKALNRRGAVIFIHPGELQGPRVQDLPPFAVDFLLDTTRAAIAYAKSGGFEKYANLKLILSHGGGFLPFCAERVGRLCSPDGSTQAGVARLKQFHFDTALASSPYALPSLLALAQPRHITFGSDWPYAAKERGAHFTRLLDEYPLDSSLRAGINRDNAAIHLACSPA